MRFLLFMIAVYVVLGILSRSLLLSTLTYLCLLLIRLIPIFLLVILLMAVTNYLFTPEFIRKHLVSGRKAWLLAVVGGVLSTGPIYMWYPFLADLRKKGFSYGQIATFLYNRAVKIPLLPVMIAYFGVKYVVVLTLVMIIASLMEGAVVDLLLGGEYESSGGS